MVSNITPGINSKLGKNLHNEKNHPLEIIKRGRIELKALKLNSSNSFQNELGNLAMVAREGKTISTSILDKMKEDKKNAKK